MSGVPDALKASFRPFGRQELLAAGTGVIDEPFEDRVALVADLTAAAEVAYRVSPQPPLDPVVFPSLLGESDTLALSRSELEDEILLLLERKQEIPLQDDTYIYSVRATAPAPFSVSSELEQVIGQIRSPLANQVRSGYLTHDVLYGLLSDPGRLVAVLDLFLRRVNQVEVKVRRAPQDQRAVLVGLTS